MTAKLLADRDRVHRAVLDLLQQISDVELATGAAATVLRVQLKQLLAAETVLDEKLAAQGYAR